jgi:hypothetical protein
MRSPTAPKPDAAASNQLSALHRRRMLDRAALALRAASDGDRDKRLAALECPWCFYQAHGRIGGSAMTGWTCAECHQDQPLWSSTATPKLCPPCAHELELCRECGADLDLRHRRTLHRMRAGDRIFSKRGKRVAFTGDVTQGATYELHIKCIKEPIKLQVRPGESALELSERINVAITRALRESEVA